MQEKKQKKRSILIGGIVAFALVLTGGAVWGLTAYRDAQITQEAEAHAAAVHEAKEAAQAAHAMHAGELAEAGLSLETVHVSLDVARARAELFTIEALETFQEAVESLTLQIENPVATDVSVSIDEGDAFIEQFRAASADERAQLADQSEAAVAHLEEQRALYERATADLQYAAVESQRAAVALMVDTPTYAETVAADHPEAEDSIVVAMTDTATGDDWSAVQDEELAERVTTLHERLIEFIESVDRVKESHVEAVKAREEAEAAAAEAERRAAEAAAAARQNTGGGGGGGGGGHEVQILCNVWEPDFFSGGSTLVLKPC